MKIRLPGAGVGVTLMMAVAILSLFVVVSGAIAIYSFNEFHRNFDRLASTQTDTMIAAARLQQESEALAGYAPKLFAKGLDQTTLLEFSVEVYTKQAKLQSLIDELAQYVGETGSIATIKKTSAALFQDIDTLSTEIFSKAAAEDGVKTALSNISGVYSEAIGLADGSAAGAAWLDKVRAVDPILLDLLTARDVGQVDALLARASKILDDTAEAAGLTPQGTDELSQRHDRLRSATVNKQGVFFYQRQFILENGRLRELLEQNQQTAGEMIGAVGALMTTVRSEIASQNETQGKAISSRGRLLQGIILFGILGAFLTAVYVQLRVIRRLNKLRHSMLNEESAEGAALLA